MASVAPSPTQPRRRRHARRRAAVALLAVACGLLATLGLLALAGYRPLVVRSASMAPAVATGDLIITKAVRPTGCSRRRSSPPVDPRAPLGSPRDRCSRRLRAPRASSSARSRSRPPRVAFSGVAVNAANTFQAASSFCTASTQAVTASADTYIEEFAPNANYGADVGLEVISANGADTRSLVRFTLPAAPAGCSVVSSTLRFDVGGGVYSSGRTLEARRVAGSWAENTVAWSTQPLSVVNGLATATSGVGPIVFDVTALVAAMYSGTTNQGFLIRDSVENGATPTYRRSTAAKRASIPPR